MADSGERQLKETVLRRKAEEQVYIIAHYYQRPEVQDIADFVGDSYAMALAARNADYDTILVAGVDFMAETAAILCPGKTVLSPEPLATCPMASSISARELQDYRDRYPDCLVVSYVNTPAEVKAVSDVCCTSSNAEKIIRQLPGEKRIFFVPDRNLAVNVAAHLDRPIDMYDSCCPIHAPVSPDDIVRQKKEHPQALVLVHPECDPEVVGMADFVGSTGGIIDYVNKSEADTFIIATECGIIHAIEQRNPGKKMVLASSELICPNMKSITLEKILYSIENRQTVITVPEDTRIKAVQALEAMIALVDQSPR